MEPVTPTDQIENAIPEATGPLRKRRARPWHRILGLLAALPLVWVVITGAVLNHTVDWKLDQIMINHPWILNLYGMAPKGEPLIVELGGHEVVEWDGVIFLDGHTVEVPGRLVGAVKDADGFAIITESHVMRCDDQGIVLEVMDELSLPPLPIAGVAVDVEGVHLHGADGWYRMAKDWLEFERSAGERVAQSLQPLQDEDSKRRLREDWAHGGLPLSRVLLDAHAGKFLGAWSRYFYDGVAIATVWLCVTGLILFFRKPRRAR